MKVVAGSSVFTGTGSAQGCPKLPASSRSEFEVLRQYSDDGSCDPTQRDHLADHIPSSAEAFLPGRVAQNYSWWRTRKVLARVEVTAQHRGDPERAKKTIAHARARHQL